MRKLFKSDDRGMLTLEACVSVMLFILFFLFISSFLNFFMAQNLIAHALIATSESLSMDQYYNDAVSFDITDESSATVSNALLQLFDTLYNKFNKTDSHYANSDKWYQSIDGKIDETVIRERFAGYISADNSNGNKKTDQKLVSLNVVGGLSGIDFSETEVKDGTLYLTAKYKLHFNLRLNGIGEIEAEQTVCAKMWDFPE